MNFFFWQFFLCLSTFSDLRLLSSGTNPVFTDIYLPMGNPENRHITLIKVVISDCLGGARRIYLQPAVYKTEVNLLEFSTFETGKITKVSGIIF